MDSSSPKPNELIEVPVLGAMLTGLFVTVTILILALILVPKLFLTSAGFIVFWCLGLALVVSVYECFRSSVALAIFTSCHPVCFIILGWFMGLDLGAF